MSFDSAVRPASPSDIRPGRGKRVVADYSRTRAGTAYSRDRKFSIVSTGGEPRSQKSIYREAAAARRGLGVHG